MSAVPLSISDYSSPHGLSLTCFPILHSHSVLLPLNLPHLHSFWVRKSKSASSRGVDWSGATKPPISVLAQGGALAGPDQRAFSQQHHHDTRFTCNTAASQFCSASSEVKLVAVVIGSRSCVGDEARFSQFLHLVVTLASGRQVNNSSDTRSTITCILQSSQYQLPITLHGRTHC